MTNWIDHKLDNLLPKPIKPFKDIIWFLFLFLAFDFIWKLFVREGEEESIMLVLGHDLTSLTDGLCLWTAKAIHWLVHDIFGYTDFTREGITLYFNREERLPVDIVWACTGLKQLLMFSFIIAFYFGPVKKKLWYIPLAALILLTINIVRLAIIFVIIKDPFPEWFIHVNEWYNDRAWVNSQAGHHQFYKDWFNVFHRDILTWIYYDGVMFLLWLFWEEKINKPYQRLLKNK
ncbi:exosortase/archaeosortase family protein [Dysgonomonas sp. 25]|uniref:exosortase/archaeosortase family protein n=1 Tax=Dysgonomonas sp. 25 TaxID=2302933 RepID=UPI002103336C|nr:exosortase/archaeosortase family protein [Dysgonomonas sp. 25]